jgi:hypothetical protein
VKGGGCAALPVSIRKRAVRLQHVEGERIFSISARLFGGLIQYTDLYTPKRHKYNMHSSFEPNITTRLKPAPGVRSIGVQAVVHPDTLPLAVAALPATTSTRAASSS